MAGTFIEERQRLLDCVQQSKSWDSLLPILSNFPTRDDPHNVFHRVREIILEVLTQKPNDPTLHSLIITHAPFQVIPRGVLIKILQTLGNFPDLIMCMMTCVQFRDVVLNPKLNCFGALSCCVRGNAEAGEERTFVRVPGSMHVFRWNKETMMIEMEFGSILGRVSQSPERNKHEAWFFKYIVPLVREFEITHAFLSLEPARLEPFVARMRFFHSQFDDNTDAFRIQHNIKSILGGSVSRSAVQLETCYHSLQKRLAFLVSDERDKMQKPLKIFVWKNWNRAREFRLFPDYPDSIWIGLDMIHAIADRSRLARLNLVARREEIAQFFAFTSKWDVLIKIVTVILREDFEDKKDYVVSILTQMIHALVSCDELDGVTVVRGEEMTLEKRALSSFFETVAFITMDEKILEQIARQVIVNIGIMKRGGDVLMDTNVQGNARTGYRILFAFIVSLVDDDNEEMIDDLIRSHHAWELLWLDFMCIRESHYVMWAASNLALGSPMQQDQFGIDELNVADNIRSVVISMSSALPSEQRLIGQLGVLMRNFTIALNFGGFTTSMATVELCVLVFELCLQVYESTDSQKDAYSVEACIVAFYEMVSNGKLHPQNRTYLETAVNNIRNDLLGFSKQSECSEEAKEMIRILMVS